MEKESAKDVFLRYGILPEKRDTEKQRANSLRAAQKQLEQARFPVDIIRVSALLMRREPVNMYNPYADDLRKAGMVFITYYDVPPWQFYSKGQKAFDTNWSRGDFLLHTLLFLCCMITIVAFLYIIVIPSLQKHGFMSLWGAMSVLIYLLGFYGIRHMRGGIAVGNIMVRNSSSLITLLVLTCDLSEQERQHVAFAVTDEGTYFEYGLRMLQEYIRKKHIQRVYLDSIGNVGKLQGFADRRILEGLHEKLVRYVEWHDLVEDKRAYGDILLAFGSCGNECVPLEIEKRTGNGDPEQQAIKVIQVLRALMISCVS